MVEKKTESLLINFMKKQVGNKTSKQFDAKKSTASLQNGAEKNNKKKNSAKEGANQDDEMSEEEKLAEAKKESINKAGERDQTEMIKKLIIENVAKYVLLIALLVTAALGIIKLGPIVAGFFHGLFFRIIIGG